MNKPVKIAVLEDDIPIKDLYVFKLKHEGFDVRAATDGVVGLKLIEDYLPDLVLLDLFMPELNGVEVLEAVRKAKWGKHLKVMVLTNIGEDEAPKKLFKLGINRYLVKALYTPKQVVEIVKEVLAS